MQVKFSISDDPMVDVEIDGNLYPIGISPGLKFPMNLDRKIITNINKKPYGKVQWKSITGVSFEASSYTIPKIKIGDLVWTDVITTEVSEESVGNVTLWKNLDTTKTYNKYVGELGRPFFEKYNILFDFSHEKIIISNDYKKMKQEGYDLEKMVKIPLQDGRGIILSAATDLGIRNFDIDTGSTLNIIRTSLLQGKECKPELHGLDTFTTSKFIVSGNDFGQIMLYSYELPTELHEIEGTLGMSFLNDHIVYFDYKNRVVYIDK